MRRILYAIILSLLAVPAYAQQWDQVNGSMQVRSGPSTPLVIIDQTNATANSKILSLRASGTEKCYFDIDGDMNCSGSFTLSGPLLLGDGTAAAPSYSFSSSGNSDNGMFLSAANVLGFSAAGTERVTISASAVTSTVPIVAPVGTVGAPGLTLGNDPTSGFYSAAVDARAINYTYSSTAKWKVDGAGAVMALASDWSLGFQSATSVQSGSPDVVLSRGAANRLDLASGDSFAIITNQPTAPTDSTAVDPGTVTRLRSSSTITPASAGVGNCAAAFLAAATTADCTIATLPAGMQLQKIYAEVTAGFTCSGTCTGTKVVQCGTAAGGTEVLAAAFDVTATGVAGDADAELGSGMTRAAAIQGGLLGSWTTTTPISCRFTSGTGNWGNAAATFVNAGSIKFTLITEQLK